MRGNREWKIPQTISVRLIMRFSSYQNCELKSKSVMSWSSRKKKECFFVTYILYKENLFNICILSHCIVYWTKFQNTYNVAYQKTLLHKLLLLVFEIAESRILNTRRASNQKRWIIIKYYILFSNDSLMS